MSIEGVDLNRMSPGSVVDVSATVGMWLVVQGYAYPEMRRTSEDGNDSGGDPLPVEGDRRRR
jgi:hypothetical protein